MRLPQRLPHIEGRRGVIVRALYWLMAVPVAIVVVLGLWFSTRDMLHNFPTSMQFGFRTYTYGAAGHAIGAVTPEGKAAGVRVGDRIVAVDGVALPAGASEFRVGDALGSVTGASVRLSVAGADGKTRTLTLAQNQSPWTLTDPRSGLPLWGYALVSFLTVESIPVFLIAVSMLLALRRRSDPEALIFAVVLLLVSQRPGSLFWWSGAPPQAVLQTVFNTGWLLSFVAIAGFPDGRFTSRTARITVLVALALVAANVAGTVSALVTGRFAPGVNLAGIIALVAVILGAAISVLLRYRATPTGPERQQIKWATGGFCVTLTGILALIATDLLDNRDGLAEGNTLQFLLVSLYQLLAMGGVLLGLIFSLLRYRLYDAEATLSRSTVYAMLTVSLLAIFAATEKVVEALGQQYFGGSLGTIAGGIGAALAAVMIAPLHNKLSDWSEKRFQQALVSLRTGLPLLMGDLRETATLEELARAAVKRAEIGVRARHAALLVESTLEAARHIDTSEVAAWREGWTPREAEGLDCDKGDPVFPMRVPLEADGCGRVGWLLLGPRPDGSFYGKDEREALAAIGDPVARAIAIVRQREASRTQFESRIGALEAAIARLTKRGKAPA